MQYAIIAIIVVAVVIGFIYNYKRNKEINERGIEVDAVVSRIKEIEGEDADGHRTVKYEYFVKYRNEMGENIEAKLGNPPRFLTEGTELRVKYLPEKPKYAQVVKK